MTSKQQSLLNTVEANPGLTTHALATLRGDYQAYETSLRDRLFRLADRGVIRFEEKKAGRQVVARRWFAI
jgi:predicted transcriptional regulator